MHNHARLMLCIAVSFLLAPATCAQEKSQPATGSRNTACAIMIMPDERLAGIGNDMPAVRKALDLEVTSRLWGSGKIAELEKVYNNAIAEARQNKGQNSVIEARVQKELGDLYVKKGNYKSAEPPLRKAIQILEMPSNAKANRDILAGCYEYMGYVYNGKKQFPQALIAFKKWLTIMDADGVLAREPSSDKYASALERIADVYTEQKNFKAAEPLLKRSLVIRKLTYGENGYMTGCVKERLAKVYEGLGNSQEIAKINDALIQSKIKELGPELGPFYAKCSQSIAASESILPLAKTVGPGSNWNLDLFTKEIQKKLGATIENSAWYKIPGWYAGLWGEIPKGVKVKETNGILWTDPPPMGFYSGPGPFASRKGFIRSNNGWWHLDENGEQSPWTQSGNVGSDKLVYIYYHYLAPVTNSDGSVKIKTVVMNFEVKPKVTVSMNNMTSLFPAGTVTRVWQENRISIIQQLAPRKYAGYNCERVYDWNGKEISTTPEGHSVFRNGGACWQKKCGEAKAVEFAGRNIKQELKQYLTKRKMFDEIKALQ
ncbi:MAG: tetratricopeptide repeat protein [Cyanobacteria bacterium TGS_CYA1]|nr:tetratricopeptide repeat protein [Cyanobacteria bacterium TGS_CYA1]